MKKYLLIALFAISPFLVSAQCFVQVQQTNVSCYGACDGTAMAFPVGNGPFTYNWMPGNMTTQNITGVCAFVYTLTVVDNSNGCMATAIVTITQPAILNLTMASTPATCPSCCDGSITATAFGGTTPYTYVWTPSGGNGPVAQGLCAGSYTCCVTDANGCSTCSSLSVSFLTSIQNQTEKGLLTIYPNPASDFVTVDESFENPTSCAITLSNVLGETVYAKSSGSVVRLHESIDLSALPNGIYFLKVKTTVGSSTRKIIKE